MAEARRAHGNEGKQILRCFGLYEGGPCGPGTMLPNQLSFEDPEKGSRLKGACPWVRKVFKIGQNRPFHRTDLNPG